MATSSQTMQATGMQPDEQFDAIIIGAGIAAIPAAGTGAVGAGV